MVTSLATTSNRLASSAAKIESHGVSTNSTLTAELLADRAGDVDVVTGELAGGRIVVAERGVDAFGAHPQDARETSRYCLLPWWLDGRRPQ